MTMILIRGFLLVISALIVGARFTVLTVQRTCQIGLLEALDASNTLVRRDGLGQMSIRVTHDGAPLRSADRRLHLVGGAFSEVATSAS